MPLKSRPPLRVERALRDASSNAMVPEGWWPGQLEGWLGEVIPALGAKTFNLAQELAGMLEPKLIKAEGAAEMTAGRMVAEQFVAVRGSLYAHTPAVQNLLVDVQAFG